TSFSGGTATTAQYAIHIRALYRQDAQRVVAQHPWWGVGVGNYHAGSVTGGDINTDPHQIFLFQRVEGGPLLEGAFIVLVIGSISVLGFTRLRRSPFAPAAMGVLVATITHGLVDVYWVRGTPVLGWLLVGAAAAYLAPKGANSALGTSQRDRPLPSRR